MDSKSQKRLMRSTRKKLKLSLDIIDGNVDHIKKENFQISNLVQINNASDQSDASTSMEIEIPESGNFNNAHSPTKCEENMFEKMFREEESLINKEDKSKFNYTVFVEGIREWAVNGNISHTNLSKLLGLLKQVPNLTQLPIDARTLLHTPRNTHVKIMNPGSFYYFGIASTLNKLCSNQNYVPPQNCMIELGINIDGLPLSKSVRSTFYPLLCIVKSVPELMNIVSLIGLYHGPDKPDSNDLLSDFVNESINLCNNGIVLNEVLCRFRIAVLTCDLPAKSYVLKTKGHMGYFSCCKCKQEGDYVDRVMCFPEITFNKRTDHDFRTKIQPEHHIGTTVLTELPEFDIVRDAPLDYMHLICLGVVKRILAGKKHGLIFGKPPFKLASRNIIEISKRMENLKKYIPVEFSRKTRSIVECKTYKATEFRLFLLYVAPVVLKNIVKKSIYSNILTLHLATTILISKQFHKDAEYLKYAENLMTHFVKSSLKLYGEDFVTHNVHSLLHISEDVKFFGQLDNFSAFPYENYMQTLKNILRKHHKPLEQVVKRTIERDHPLNKNENKSNSMLSECSHEHFNGPTMPHCRGQFKTIKLQNFVLKLNVADSCVQLNNKEIVKILNICSTEEGNVIIGKTFIDKKSFYKIPCDSRTVDIYLCKTLSSTLESWKVEEIRQKVVLLPFQDALVAFSMLH